MNRLTIVVPGSLDTLTGGYGYDRRIAEGLRKEGWAVDVVELDGSFPFPTPAALDQAARALANISTNATVMIDGLACGAMPLQVEAEAARLRFLSLVHHPLADESGLDPAAAEILEASERRALAAVRVVVVTSRATVRSLERFGVAPDRVRVVEPGTDRAPLARGSRTAVVHLVSVATLIKRKGHDILFRALAGNRTSSWRLTCVGSLVREPRTVAYLRGLLAELQLEERVSLCGEMSGDTLEAQYDCADVFVLATLHEGYGMAVAEALAHGIPVISTPTGAIPDLIGVPAGERSAGPVLGEAGMLVPANDVESFSAALGKIIADSTLRARLVEGARAARERLIAWPEASRRMAAVISDVQR